MPKPLTRLIDILNWITTHFDQIGIESPRRNAEWLIEHVLNIPRLELYLQFDRPLSIENRNQLRTMVRQRAAGVPIQQVVGYAEFYGLKIIVTPDVMIPRQETEILVEKILQNHPNAKTILDIGTGSGCIAIALGKNLPNCKMFAVDIERSAIAVAQKNAETNGVEIQWDCQNIFQWEPENKFDIIVSNPPYIAHEESQNLPQEVRDHEPALALFADKDGLQYYPRLAEISAEFLHDGGVLWVEIGGEHHVEPVQKFFEHAGLLNVEIFFDLTGFPRIMKAEKSTTPQSKD